MSLEDLPHAAFADEARNEVRPKFSADQVMALRGSRRKLLEYLLEGSLQWVVLGFIMGQ